MDVLRIWAGISAAAVFAGLAGCGAVVQNYAADLGVTGPGTVKSGSAAKIEIRVTSGADVAQLAILFPDGWLDDNSLVSAGICKPRDSVPGEVDCGALKAGQATTFTMTATAKKAGSRTYGVAVSDIGPTGTKGQPLVKDANGTEVIAHFTEVVD